MKVYTIEDFENFETDDFGRKICPSGDYSQIKQFGERCSFGERWRAVDPETVGEYTGVKGKNGKKIFEGDEVISKYGTIGAVEWDNEECSFLVNIGDDYQMLTDSDYTVIGTIYDNPELLEDK